MNHTLARSSLFALLFAALSCRGAPRPNVLLITIDALRLDYLSCFGGAHAPTPNIDALAQGGVLFTQTITDVPWTRSAIASLMTAQYANVHKLRSPYQRLGEPRQTLAATLAAAGYQTGAVVSTFELDHVFRLDQGFATYDDRYTAPLIPVGNTRPLHFASIFYGDIAQDRGFRWRKLQSDSMRGDTETTSAAVAWLRRTGDRPFFLWVHYLGPHRFRTQGAELEDLVNAYQPGVLRVDTEVGHLAAALRDLRLSDNTLLVVLADQGQSLLEHGAFGYGRDLYEPSIHVPLLMWWPQGLPAGRRVAALTRLVDVFPTVAELTGVRAPEALEGRSLVGLIRGTETSTVDEVYCETFLPSLAQGSWEGVDAEGRRRRFGVVKRGLRGGRWKFIRTEPGALIDVPLPTDPPAALRAARTVEELYDLSGDPNEQQNVIDQQPAVAAEMRTRLDRYARAAPP